MQQTHFFFTSTAIFIVALHASNNTIHLKQATLNICLNKATQWRRECRHASGKIQAALLNLADSQHAFQSSTAFAEHVSILFQHRHNKEERKHELTGQIVSSLDVFPLFQKAWDMQKYAKEKKKKHTAASSSVSSVSEPHARKVKPCKAHFLFFFPPGDVFLARTLVLWQLYFRKRNKRISFLKKGEKTCLHAVPWLWM